MRDDNPRDEDEGLSESERLARQHARFAMREAAKIMQEDQVLNQLAARPRPAPPRWMLALWWINGNVLPALHVLAVIAVAAAVWFR